MLTKIRERRAQHGADESNPTNATGPDRTGPDGGRHRAAAADGPREVVNIAWRPAPRPARSWGMHAARGGVVALGAAMGYVSYWTQQELVMQVKHDFLVASLEAAGPDLGALIFAALGHVQARRGSRPLAARLLSALCVATAITMNVLAVGIHADIARLAVAVLPPALYAVAADRLIAEVADQNRATEDAAGSDRSAWLVLLRWLLNPFTAAAALYRWVMDHVSPTPGPSAVELRAAAETERAREMAAAAERDVHEARQWAETTVGQLHDQNRTELDSLRQAHAAEIGRLQAQLADATAAAELTGLTKKEALLRQYKRLRDGGDHRYGKREYVAEIAAELAPQAGDLHVKTAENYLRAHLDGEEAPQINGREHRPEGDMIGVTG